MAVQYREGENLSNVYLYKNGELELIRELENVFIKRVCTCSNSINVLLNSKNGKSCNMLIRLDVPRNGEGTRGGSFLNISHSDMFDFNYITSDLNLYSFHSSCGTKEMCKAVHGEKSRTAKWENCPNGNQNERHFLTGNGIKNERTVLLTKSLKDELVKGENENRWNYKTDKEERYINQIDKKQEKNVCTKWLHTNSDKIFFCSYEFYAIDKKKEIFKWNIDIQNNEKIILHYKSKFVNYINFSVKVNIIHVSCGHNHALFLSEDKNCYAFGCNDNYQVCEEKKNFYNTPKLVIINKKETKKIKLIAAGYSHNIICTYENEVYGWGNNMHGQIFRQENFVKSPTLILNQNLWTNLNKKKLKLKKKKKWKRNSHWTWTSFQDPIAFPIFGKVLNGMNKDGDNFVRCNCSWGSISQANCPHTMCIQRKVFPDMPNELQNGRDLTELKRIHEAQYELKKWKRKNKFELEKICCGFSFSCILLKNKNCYTIGKTNLHKKGNIKMPKKINKKKKIDDIFCNFFHIIVVDHLKISNIYPTIVQPHLDKTILLFFNFKIKKEMKFHPKLAYHYLTKRKKIKNKNKNKNNPTLDLQDGEVHQNMELLEYGHISSSSFNQMEEDGKGEKEKGKGMQNMVNNLYTDVFFHFNNDGDETQTEHLGRSNFFNVSSAHSDEQGNEYSMTCKINNHIMNKKLLLTLCNSNIFINYNQSIIFSQYEGKIKSIIPNNFALIENIKIKIKINKVPFHVRSDYIYVLYHFTDDEKNELLKFGKGILSKKRTSIFTKMSFVWNDLGGNTHTRICDHKSAANSSVISDLMFGDTSYHAPHSDNDKWTDITPQFTKCSMYFSFGQKFYPSSSTIVIIKPDILNITPNYVNLHDNSVININMLHLSRDFDFIHVLLYNPHLQFIHIKAYYNSEERNFSFSMPLIPITIFKKAKLGTLTVGGCSSLFPCYYSS
ncbi:conserved Plasmodium protein, unknown function [Plasmodium ovale wallikeri]|uniref:Regulator of chromosome condensation n=1 Tax=Plasmodium ovale wallikeri TaxID=864142 RepID=A0A1A8YWJ5_PLAOA|nr:conserved Plasmodium protein, unknown function [Plasmodium ovale wallikeri]SBT36240.1 conserved Plasmodium protein, unknown function [Plasmodium ovale wallikeri]